MECSKCACSNGEVKCRPIDDINLCRYVGGSNTTRPCTSTSASGRQVTFMHGESVSSECRRCVCYDGNLRCVRRRECRTDDCYKCRDEKINPVCGRNGRTYQSPCHAMNCGGLTRDLLTLGKCSSIVSQPAYK